MATKKYIIKTPAGLVAGFSREHQQVQLAGHPDYAKLFGTRSAAQAFVDKYADAGFGLVSATAVVEPA